MKALNWLRKSRSKDKRPGDQEDWLLLWDWARWEIRDVDKTFRLPSDSSTDDALIQAVAGHLTDCANNVSDETRAIVAHRGPQLSALRDKTIASETARLALARYLVHDASIRRQAGLQSIAELREARAREIYPENQHLPADVSDEVRAVINERIRTIRSEIGRRFGFNLEMTFGDVMSLIAFISVLFLVAGYIRATLLLWGIGLSASPLFTIADYLASSASTFWLFLLSSIVSVGAFLIGVAESSRRSAGEQRRFQEHAKRFGWFLLLLYLVPILFLAGVMYAFKGRAYAFAWVLSCALPAAMYGVARLLRPVHRSPTAEALVLLALTMIASVIGATVVTIVNLVEGAPPKQSELQIVLKDRNHVPLGPEIELVMANSNYVILWDYATRRAHAVPRDNVESLSSSP